MDMYGKMVWVVLAVCLLSSVGLIVHAVNSNPRAEVVNKSIQELSKSCIETHNGTFTVNFMVGDVNQIEYQCVIGAK